MPTIDNLINTLVTDCDVEVESSQTLLNRIRHKQNLRDQYLMSKHKPGVPTKTVTPIAMFNPPKTIQIEPIWLLHSIGLITTPPNPQLSLSQFYVGNYQVPLGFRSRDTADNAPLVTQPNCQGTRLPSKSSIV